MRDSITGHSRSHFLLPALLLMLALGFFWRVLVTPDGFIYKPGSPVSDLTITHWPNAWFIKHSLLEWGQVPLWRPLIMSGTPFVSNPLSGLWYPPYYLLLVFPLTVGFNILIVLHTAWAGWGGYRLLHEMGASKSGSFLAAVVLMFAPKSIVHLSAGHVGLYFAWAWVPWLLVSVRRLAREGGGRHAAWAAASAGMLILADVRMGFYSGLTAALVWMVLSLWRFRQGAGGWQHGLIAGIGAAALAVGLISVQMLPLAAVSGRLNRGGLTLAESGIASLPLRYLLGLLIADHGGFQEWMTYVGAVTLALTVVGVRRWRSKERWMWLGVGLFAAIYSLGTNTPLYGLLYELVPALQWLRGPARAWFLVVLAAAILSAQGITALEGAIGRRKWGNLAAAGLAMAALAGGLGAVWLRLPLRVGAAVVIWSVCGLLIALRRSGKLRGPVFSRIMVGLALGDLWLIGFSLVEVRPPSEVLVAGQEASVWLASQPGQFRVYSPSYSIPHHVGAIYGIESADGVDPFQLAQYAEFMRCATGASTAGYSVTIPVFPETEDGEDMLMALRDVVPSSELLGLLNVRYVAAAYPIESDALKPLGERGGVLLYENEWALPRVFLAPPGGWGWRGGEAMLQRGIVDAAAPSETTTAIPVAPRIARWTPNWIEVEVDGAGLLVLSEIYDPDWSVFVDSEVAELVRVEGVLRGVQLGEGSHTVRFVYRPALLGVGAALSLAAYVTVALLVVFGRRPERECR